MNLFCHGPVERGLDVSAGGVNLYNLTSDGVGLATVADSFAAVEQRVVVEKRLTSANPDPGFMPGGTSAPTAKANAVAAVQPGWGNSAPLQMDLDSGLARDLGGVEAIESLIKTHNDQGGTLININVISRDMILAAHADPDRYPDLVVRATGFSAYFRSLSPEYRQLVVERVLSEG